MNKDLCQRIVDIAENLSGWSRYDLQSPGGIWFHFDHLWIQKGVCEEFDELWRFVDNVIPQYPNRQLGSVRLNRYNAGDFTESHRDAAQDRKYTLLIQMSDSNDYEGGDLIVKGAAVSREKGSYVLFNSQVDYHSVNPLTKGRRYSIVHWAYQIPLDKTTD